MVTSKNSTRHLLVIFTVHFFSALNVSNAFLGHHQPWTPVQVRSGKRRLSQPLPHYMTLLKEISPSTCTRTIENHDVNIQKKRNRPQPRPHPYQLGLNFSPTSLETLTQKFQSILDLNKDSKIGIGDLHVIINTLEKYFVVNGDRKVHADDVRIAFSTDLLPSSTLSANAKEGGHGGRDHGGGSYSHSSSRNMRSGGGGGSSYSHN